MFTASDYSILSKIVFQEDYPGYRPQVKESPNGDSRVDFEKKYSHVAMKYLEGYKEPVYLEILSSYLSKAHSKAVETAIKLGVAKEFWPSFEHGALRVLEYTPGAITNPHTDFDLFTLMLYRNIPENFRYVGKYLDTPLEDYQSINKQIHFGEILELINPYFKATPHEVVTDPHDRTQYSIVYFAIPDHEAVLPSGQKVGEWLDERIMRSRY